MEGTTGVDAVTAREHLRRGMLLAALEMTAHATMRALVHECAELIIGPHVVSELRRAHAAIVDEISRQYTAIGREPGPAVVVAPEIGDEP